MNNKITLTIKLILLTILTLFLINIVVNTQNGKIIPIPFLICSIAMIGNTISLIIENKKSANIFYKIYIIGFLIFLFSILIYWSYQNIINKTYANLLVSIPFWIAAIFVAKKRLFNKPTKNNNKKLNINYKIIISSLLIIIALLSGILMLFFGIKDNHTLNTKTKNYITTNGYFDSYSVYNDDEEGKKTYKLTFIYNVNGIEYSITTSYGTNYIPEKNSIREVKYNPNDPNEAILVGTNTNKGLIFIGAFFILVPVVFIICALSMMGYLEKFKIDIAGIVIGIVLLVIGIGSIVFQNGTTMSTIETFKSFGIFSIIPISFILVGILQIKKCLLPKKSTKNY